MSPKKPALPELAKTTQAVYERNAERFDAERPKGLHERPWIDRFLARIPQGGRILDVGCGSGEPIAAYMINHGYDVVGVDASHAMIAIASARSANRDWRLADMRELALAEPFHGIVAWNSFFHLTRDEQRQVLPRFAAHLLPSGILMLTVGPRDGEVEGCVGDDPVYHASLSPDEYESILSSLDMEVIEFVEEDPECDMQTILMARVRRSSVG